MKKSKPILWGVVAVVLFCVLGVSLGVWVKNRVGTRSAPKVVSVLDSAADDQELYDAVLATGDVFFGAISHTNAVTFSGVVDFEALYERIPLELKNRLVLALQKPKMIQAIEIGLRRNLPQLAAFQRVGTEWRLTSVETYADGSVKGVFRLIDPDGYSSFTSLFLRKENAGYRVIDWIEEDAGLTMSTAMGLGMSAGINKDPRLVSTARFVQQVSPLIVEEDFEGLRMVLDDLARDEIISAFQPFHDLMNASCYAFEEEWAKSEELATRILSVEGAYPGTYFLRGTVRAWQENHEGALADFSMYTNTFGRTAEVLVEIAGVYQSMGQTNNALTHVEWAAEDQPTSLDVYYVACEFAGEEDGKWFAGLLEKHKESVLELGEDLLGYIAWDSDPDAVEMVVDVFREQDPENYNVHYYTGVIEEEREAYEKAMRAYLRAWQLGPEEEAYDILEEVTYAASETDTPEMLFELIQADQVDEVLDSLFEWVGYEGETAGRVLAAARTLLPQSLAADYWEGDLLLSRKQWVDVQALVEKNLARAAAGEVDGDLVRQWAEAAAHQGDWERGFSLFEEEVHQTILFEVCAHHFYETGQGEMLKRLLTREGKRLDPGWEKAFWTGVLEVVDGRWSAAEETLREVSEVMPEDAWREEYLLTEARVVLLAQLGRKEDALKHIEQEEVERLTPYVHAVFKDREALVAALAEHRRWSLEDVAYFEDERWFLEAVETAGYSLETLLADAAKSLPADEE